MPNKAVLISIKPRFAEKILSGKKKYEFRKSIFKDRSITKIVIYSSSPVQKVVGEFAIGRILADRPKGLWWRAGIGEDKEFFFDYFNKARKVRP